MRLRERPDVQSCREQGCEQPSEPSQPPTGSGSFSRAARQRLHVSRRGQSKVVSQTVRRDEVRSQHGLIDTDIALQYAANLINTRPTASKPDELSSVAALLAQMDGWGWTGAQPSTDAELETVRRVRGRLREYWDADTDEAVRITNELRRDGRANPQLVNHEPPAGTSTHPRRRSPGDPRPDTAMMMTHAPMSWNASVCARTTATMSRPLAEPVTQFCDGMREQRQRRGVPRLTGALGGPPAIGASAPLLNCLTACRLRSSSVSPFQARLRRGCHLVGTRVQPP